MGKIPNHKLPNSKLIHYPDYSQILNLEKLSKMNQEIEKSFDDD